MRTHDVRFGSEADTCNAQGYVRFTPNSGHRLRFRHVRFGPKADIRHLFDHFIGGIQEPFRNRQAERLSGLEVNDKLKLGRLHHRQVPGLLALENPSDVNADLPIASGKIGAVAHQAAGLSEFAVLVDGRDRVPRRQRDYFVALAVEERIGADQHRSGVQLRCSCERSIDGVLVAREQYMYLLADSARCFLNLPHFGRVSGTIRIEEYSDQLEPRNKRAQQANPLTLQHGGKKIHTGHVALGPANAGDEAGADRVATGRKNNRDS